MKISKIEIKDFHQFKNFSIDLIYPQGHIKAGMPLDKICFIGQSGSGKTTLLELIPKFLFNYHTNLILKSTENSINNNATISISFGLNNEYTNIIEFRDPKSEEDKMYGHQWGWSQTKYNNKRMEWEKFIDYFDNTWVKEVSTKLIYFPSNLDYDIEVKKEDFLTDKMIIDFSKQKVSTVWNIILEQIQKYQEEELQLRQKTLKTVEESLDNLKTITAALQKLKKWKKNQFNPIQDVADKCLDKLLQSFKLRTKTELDIKSKDDIGFIKIEDFAGVEIPHGLWSTGTKQVILSALPLYLLKPKHTIILFDEPERSLYPDIQRMVVDYYSSLSEKCQFFYSTHSPIIASSFEPWEIVELKFDKKGNIFRELYYEGDNHVDNYKLNPQNMRWDDILQRIFDMENDGSEIRKRKLDELATNNVKYRKLEQAGKNKSKEALALLEVIQKLSKELSNWN